MNDRLRSTRVRRISAANNGANRVHQKPYGFVADVDPSLVQRVLDIAQRERTITARRITSGNVLKKRKALIVAMRRRYNPPLSAQALPRLPAA
jgi:hypothetical protein